MASTDGSGDAHGELANLAWIEALGALDPADRARLAAHLRDGCPACLDALRGGNDVVAKLAHLFAPAEPSTALRARIERASARRAPSEGAAARRAPRRVRIASAASWVALGVAAVLGYAGWRQAALLRDELSSARAEQAGARTALAQAETRAEALERDRAELSELLVAVGAREARGIALASETGAGARAFVTGERVVLLVHDLASAPPERTYQLWAIEGGVPRSAGVFDTDAEGRARFRAKLTAAIRDDAVLAVTLEPAGGVPQPTGPIVLAQR